MLDNKSSDPLLGDFGNHKNPLIDRDKTEKFRKEIHSGHGNFSVFQQFSSFNWPAWVVQKLDIQSKNYSSVVPPFLVNDTMRDGMIFTNLLSREEIFIDPSGMLSPSYDQWSLELWISIGSTLFRPCDNIQRIIQKRDPRSSVVQTAWEDKYFSLSAEVYGARSNIDEAVIEVNCTKRTGKQAVLVLCLRPYNHLRLGGLHSVQYLEDQNLIDINGRKAIHVPFKPDFVIAGKDDCDIDLGEKEDTFASRSLHGMAALALGFNLKKGGSTVHFRMALSGDSGLSDGQYNLASLKEDYISFVTHRLSSSAGLSIPDKQFKNWLDASKISALSVTENDYYLGGSKEEGPDYRSLYYILHGYHRMGCFKEAEGILQYLIGSYPLREKKIKFQQTMQGCYLICAFTDYFTHVRDISYLQSRFDIIKRIAQRLLTTSSDIRAYPHFNENSIPESCIREGNPLDMILLSQALFSFSYLARCLGIFGDEIKFQKESERLSQIFMGAIQADGAGNGNNFMFYRIYAGYPIRIPAITDAAIQKILETVIRRSGGMPLSVKPYGWDIINSLVIAANLIQQRDIQGYLSIKDLFQMGGERYTLPAYMNPATKRGCYGSGASKVVSAVLFSALRQILFVDYPERLEIFPVSMSEWFAEGTEIVVENAPSRFGHINFRIISTAHEIQFYFDKLPKYVPPDIMIRLPLKAKIVEGDDFIIKKEEGQSFIINGWPSLVRFIRK